MTGKGWLFGLLRRTSRGNGRAARATRVARAVAEALEERRLLTTFNAYIDALPTGNYGHNYTIYLYTSGGQASQWKVNWEDLVNGQPDIVTYTPGSGGTFPANFNKSHIYTSGNGPSGPIVATATLSGSSTTATASFALSQSYGSYQFQNSGRSTFSVPGTGNNNIQHCYMAIDSNTGDEYVAYQYLPGGTHSVFAVSQFDKQGNIINSWGDPNVPDGGNGILYYASGDSGNDVPEGIMVVPGGSDVIVVGKGSSGWLVVDFSTAANTLDGSGTYGSVSWHAAGTFSAGQANAAYWDTTDNYVLIGGTNGSKFAAASLTSTGTLNWSTTVDTGGISESANCIFEADGASDEQVILGGYTSYCIGNNVVSDFTLVSVQDDQNGALTSRVWELLHGRDPHQFRIHYQWLLQLELH